MKFRCKYITWYIKEYQTCNSKLDYNKFNHFEVSLIFYSRNQTVI